MEVSLLETIRFLTLPFLTCLVLAGIHCYLGLHVLARGVIFVDLSLAQVAAFGATLAALMGYSGSSGVSYGLSLGSTFLAAALFAVARRFEGRISQEAVIGIVYAFSAAALILLADQMAHGSERIKDLLVGSILWVSWPQLIKTIVIYAVVSLVHFGFRHQLIKASWGGGLPRQGLWDFLFYALFGIVITSSVRIAGVLQVFSYLIVPAVVSSVFFSSIRSRLFFGWALGFVLSFLGITVSYVTDLPSGAFLVVCFTSLPILLLLALPVLPKPRQ